MATLGLGYLAEVPCTTHVWTTRPEQSGSPSRSAFSALSQEFGAVTDALPEGSKSPQAILGTILCVMARRGRKSSLDVLLLLRRNPSHKIPGPQTDRTGGT